MVSFVWKRSQASGCWLVLVLLFATLLPGTLRGDVLPLGAAAGERLQFDVRWLGVVAGNAKMTMNVVSNHYVLQATLATTGVVRVLHSLDELLRAEGTLAAYQFQARQFHKERLRDKNKQTTTYDFDPEMLQVVRVHRESDKTNLEQQVIPLNAVQTVDPLSSFYALRAWSKLLPNATFPWFVVDGQKIFCLTIRVGSSYRLQTALGSFVAFPVQIVVENSKKFMNQESIGDRKGGIVIWLTDDRRRLPVLVTAQLAIGAVQAELVAFDDGRGEELNGGE